MKAKRFASNRFAGIEDESELAWAQDWIADLLHREKAEITPATKQELWAALSNLASMPRVQRTLSTLLGLVQDADVRQAMRSYTLDGPHGRLLDANHDTLGDGDVERGARWQAFEMEHLMHSPIGAAAGADLSVPPIGEAIRRLADADDSR